MNLKIKVLFYLSLLCALQAFFSFSVYGFEKVSIYQNDSCDGQYQQVGDFKLEHFFKSNSLEKIMCERGFPPKFRKSYLYDSRYGVSSKDQDYGKSRLDLSEKLVFYHLGKELLVDEFGSYPDLALGVKPIQNMPRTIRLNYGFPTRESIHLSYEFLLESNDWDSLLDLNNLAKEVWDRVLSLSDKHNNYDDLKNAYLLSSKLHTKKEGREKIDHLINTYKQTVLDFLSSGGIRYTYGASMIENFHPFFSQVIIEIFTNLYRDAEVDGSFSFKSESSFLDAIVIYSSSVASKEKRNQVFETVPHLKERIKSEEVRGSVLSLMNMIAARSSCRQLGLKPELSRVILSHLESVFYGLDVGNMIKNISENVELNCGEIRWWSEYDQYRVSKIYSRQYSGYKKHILIPMRKKIRSLMKNFSWF
ncbi:hypothetical protein HBN50_12535 [Halobacteriovorax sp. GB3]|uniref:hypothetical protein n=1 Tax=Halobacteriovorax sp. GB3 TaxID=2719615 RepID=UPI0023621E21|nr:hypothetical protein [Halobacteriovorax sp. GB3]MDD0853931.1 hypothetical protein [Halobacteriovorax sp. GB3]